VANTLNVSKTLHPQPEHKVVQNKIFQVLMLTQKMIMANRKKVHQPFNPNEEEVNRKIFILDDSYMQSYIHLLPRNGEMNTMIFWDEKLLNEIDSQNIRNGFMYTFNHYKKLWYMLTESEGSPYKGLNTIPLDEFLWAITSVGSRHIVFH
jgi:hypothetical protein